MQEERILVENLKQKENNYRTVLFITGEFCIAPKFMTGFIKRKRCIYLFMYLYIIYYHLFINVISYVFIIFRKNCMKRGNR